MSTLLNAIIVAVFITAAWYINRAVGAKGIPAGITRGFLVALLAGFVALCAGELLYWVAGAL